MAAEEIIIDSVIGEVTIVVGNDEITETVDMGDVATFRRTNDNVLYARFVNTHTHETFVWTGILDDVHVDMEMNTDLEPQWVLQ